ncbi:MAG: pilus assembly protein TadG-related protein [Hyphomicrobium sp.]
MQEMQQVLKDERGSVTLIFAMSLVVMTLAVGLAIDYSRALGYYERTQAALDASSLSTSKALAGASISDADLKKLAVVYFEQAVQAQGALKGQYSNLRVAVDRDTSEAVVSVDATVHSVVGQLVGITDLKQVMTSTSVSSSKDIELGVMLDVSGSMEGNKLRALKTAGNDLIDTILTGNASTRRARIGIVPYSTSVNAGPFAVKVKANSGNGNSGNGNSGNGNSGNGNSGNGNSNGNGQSTCVSERNGAHAFTSAPPTNGRLFGSKASDCPVNTILAMTDDKDALRKAMNALVADGSTAGHLGVAWAWYLVSQQWQDFWPVDSQPGEADPKKLVKAVILMTDGMFNKEYESGNGRSARQAERLCTNMKEEGITVFTVAFDAPDEVLPLFAQCASNPAYAFNARNGGALRKSFAKIAQHLNDLRVSN